MIRSHLRALRVSSVAYLIELVDLESSCSERDLRRRLLDKLKAFPIELGHNFFDLDFWCM